MRCFLFRFGTRQASRPESRCSCLLRTNWAEEWGSSFALHKEHPQLECKNPGRTVNTLFFNLVFFWKGKKEVRGPAHNGSVSGCHALSGICSLQRQKVPHPTLTAVLPYRISHCRLREAFCEIWACPQVPTSPTLLKKCSFRNRATRKATGRTLSIVHKLPSHFTTTVFNTLGHLRSRGNARYSQRSSSPKNDVFGSY